MNCKEAIPLMHEYLDGELSGQGAAELKNHLLACPECRVRYEKLEKTEALIGTLKPVSAPDFMTERILQALPAPKKRVAWVKWFRRHPAISVAAVFVVVMLGSFLSMWDNDAEVVVRGAGMDQVVIQGKTVVVPEGATIRGNLVVENGTIRVDGTIEGNLVVIDGSYALASTAHISGEVTKVNQAGEWLWFQLNRFFTALAH